MIIAGSSENNEWTIEGKPQNHFEFSLSLNIRFQVKETIKCIKFHEFYAQHTKHNTKM